MAKKTKTKQVRWEFPDDLLTKIAMYQASNNLRNMNTAAVILLEKITQEIKPIKL